MNPTPPLIEVPTPGLFARRSTVMLCLVLGAAVVRLGAADANALLDSAAKAMGTSTLNTLQLKGSGSNGTFGQAFKPGGPWPTFKVTSYTQAINFADTSMRIDLERTNPDGPLQGSGLPLPPPLPQKQSQTLAPGATGAPATTLALQLAMSPHGVIKAARQHNATATGRTLSFNAHGSAIKATFGSDHTVQKVETLIDNPVTGDTPVVWEYSNYKDFAGVKYPTRIVQRQGDHPILDLTISEVKPNAPVSIDAAPAAAQKKAAAAAATPTVTLKQVAEGVHHVTGGSHHSMIVEFKDHVVLFEVPQNDARTMAVIDATRAAFPAKPIRYAINSHHHFDHAGGIRAAMAEGITLITQAQNKPYFEKIAALPHTLNPDRLAKTPKRPSIETVDQKRVLADGTQTLELYKLPTNHADTMLVGFLPKSKQLFQVDVYSPTGDATPTAAPSFISPVTAAFNDELAKMKLEVAQIIPGHGPRLVTLNELKTVSGKGGGN